MKKQYRQQQLKILETAFREWSKTYFIKTSLSTLAKGLNLSKTALYRYFTNKDHLLNSMAEKFINHITSALDELITRCQDDSLRNLIAHYYEFVFNYFHEYPQYCAFLHFYLMRTKPIHEEQFSQLQKKIDRVFTDALVRAGHNKDNENLEYSLRFIQLTGLFWLMQLFLKKPHSASHSLPFDFSKRTAKALIQNQIRKSQEYCLQGFTTKPVHSSADLTTIEKTSWIQAAEMLKPDRIFSAIEQVIAEEGYANSSVEKIATRIGINKSSLYFYFKNKNDMLYKTIKREQEHFIDLANARLKTYTSFSEKLYSFIITLISYTVNNPGMITVLNWARYQNVGIALPHQELHKIFLKLNFVHDVLQHNALRGSEQDVNAIFIFIFFLIMYKLRELPVKTKSRDNFTAFSRQIFTLFCYGVEGYINNHKKSQQQKGIAHVKQK